MSGGKQMRSIREMLHKSTYGAAPSMGARLLLYWFTMALLLVAAILSILMATGVLSHPARQLAGTLDIQQRNSYATLDSQMDALTAQGMVMSGKLGRELDAFLASKGISFDELNDDPDTIAELERRLYAPLSSSLAAATCSGVFFGLNVTANTSLPNAETLRAGMYLRYSGLQPTVASEQDVICFRGAAEAARSLQLQMHNRWNPELNAALIPGSETVSAYQGLRLADGCLWTTRMELPDTWEHVMLLCVPVLDGGGIVRGFCGMEVSDLYFSLSHSAVSSSFGRILTVLAPVEKGEVYLPGAMLGATDGSRLTANGTLHFSDGKYYTTYSDGKYTYLGRHQLLDAATSDGVPLAVVTLVPEGTFRSYEKHSQIAWFVGAVLLLLAMLAAATALSRRFVKPINKSLAAVRGGDGQIRHTGDRRASCRHPQPPGGVAALRGGGAAAELCPARRYPDGHGAHDPAILYGRVHRQGHTGAGAHQCQHRQDPQPEPVPEAGGGFLRRIEGLHRAVCQLRAQRRAAEQVKNKIDRVHNPAGAGLCILSTPKGEFSLWGQKSPLG